MMAVFSIHKYMLVQPILIKLHCSDVYVNLAEKAYRYWMEKLPSF